MSMTNKTALVIVDVQNDFVEGGSLGVEGGREVARKVEEYIGTDQGYSLVVATRDFHEPDSDNGGHFAMGEEAPNFSSTWPHHCVQGTDGADFAFDTSQVDVIVSKGQGEPAYSGFEGMTDKGSLREVLDDHGVKNIDVVGIATDYCVLATVIDGLDEGFKVRVLGDKIAAVASETGELALETMKVRGVEVL